MFSDAHEWIYSEPALKSEHVHSRIDVVFISVLLKLHASVMLSKSTALILLLLLNQCIATAITIIITIALGLGRACPKHELPPYPWPRIALCPMRLASPSEEGPASPTHRER